MVRAGKPEISASIRKWCNCLVPGSDPSRCWGSSVPGNQEALPDSALSLLLPRLLTRNTGQGERTPAFDPRRHLFCCKIFMTEVSSQDEGRSCLPMLALASAFLPDLSFPLKDLLRYRIL